MADNEKCMIDTRSIAMNETMTDAVVSALDAFEKCLIRMEQRGFIRDEAYLCKLILKAISYTCRQMVRGRFPDERTFSDAMNAIGEAIRAYNKTDDEKMVQGVIDGMRAMIGFESIKTYMAGLKTQKLTTEETPSRSNPTEIQDQRQ